ncbi:iron chelate uptake ABC transporter family permease subunit [Vibrio sp. SCSIO 43136]|uniref:metal ABC transporter permease n=1 Tax=Vibrio sp. SCSIO 43136 TaxID=2819101 RepID=UPI0020759831|nr:iron chelate uptake ABC transporter family permease subunit [Vibrio sp. SCSIO 43136]USD67275.1 metal ABC transporter permease [Vibrio sp. SCSIO 43136]
MNSIYRIFSDWVEQGVLPEMFGYEFLINALLASLLIGPLLGLLGTLVVVKRLAFLSEAVGHSVLTGVSIGILLGEAPTAPLISLFTFSILFALLLQWVKGRSTIPYDALIGVFLSFALAAGAALLLYVAKKVNAHLIEQVMFGSILVTTPSDLIMLSTICVIVAVLSYFYGNQAYLVAISPDIAHSQRINTRIHDYAFVILIALITVASVKIIGAVLVGALLLIPAASARLIARNLKQLLMLSIAFSTSASVMGVLIPMYLHWPVSAGPAITLFACGWFVLSLIHRQTKLRAA